MSGAPRFSSSWSAAAAAAVVVVVVVVVVAAEDGDDTMDDCPTGPVKTMGANNGGVALRRDGTAAAIFAGADGVNDKRIEGSGVGDTDGGGGDLIGGGSIGTGGIKDDDDNDDGDDDDKLDALAATGDAA
jgi:hypothetical protein